MSESRLGMYVAMRCVPGGEKEGVGGEERRGEERWAYVLLAFLFFASSLLYSRLIPARDE